METVIEGTTLKKMLPQVEEMARKGTLIDKVSFRDIKVEEAERADEMMVVGGDKIVPVLNLNGKPLRKKKGPVVE